jgi:hypothetical protein
MSQSIPTPNPNSIIIFALPPIHLMFLQMKPETKAKSGEAANAEAIAAQKSESEKPASAEAIHQSLPTPEDGKEPVEIELTEEEKLVLNLLKENSPAELNELK